MDPASSRTPPVLRHLDTASGALLLFLTVWSPWAFGNVRWEEIQVMNWTGAAMGALLVAKHVIRWRTRHVPARWSEPTRTGRWAVRTLAVLSVLVPAYVLVSVLNARATADHWKFGTELVYLPGEPVSWLPSSYDRSGSLPAFWGWSALALVFWAARDWFLGKSRDERRTDDGDQDDGLPDRIRTWLWTLVGSATVLAMTSMIQRFDGTDKLLWIRAPYSGDPSFHFGPYNYRTNGAQYFNLVWPVALGFWWSLRNAAKTQGSRTGAGAHVLLVPCTLILAASPLISSSRSGALVMGALSVGALAVFLTGNRIWQRGRWLWATAFFAVPVVLGLILGGEKLSSRFVETAKDPLNGRGEIYETARRMSAESGWFGTGAGSFTALNALYSPRPSRNVHGYVNNDWWETQNVHGYVHNDWWETQITLGWIGLGAIVVMMLLVPVIAFGSLGRPPSREFAGLVALALLGMLGHAVGDIPFQVRSLLFQFLVTMAMASAMVRRIRR